LLVLDPILHISPATVELLIENLVTYRINIRHNKTRIESFIQMLSFGDHVSASTPTLLSSIGKPPEDTRSLPGILVENFSLQHLGLNHLQETRKLGQTHHIVDLKILTAF